MIGVITDPRDSEFDVRYLVVAFVGPLKEISERCLINLGQMAAIRRSVEVQLQAKESRFAFLVVMFCAGKPSEGRVLNHMDYEKCIKEQ